MTTETMREAVARAIADAGGFDWESEFVRVVATKYADAAIRTVLERLREPSEVMVEDGRIALSASGVDDAEDEDALWCWQAMLDAAAREVG